MNEQKVGISAISTYVPPYRVDLEEWCTWTNQSWEKIEHEIKYLSIAIEKTAGSKEKIAWGWLMKKIEDSGHKIKSDNL